MSGPRRIFVVAGEPSGDALAAETIAALKARAPQTLFAGVGGPAMARAGVESAVSIEGLSVLGLVEAFGAWARVVRAAQATAEAAVAFAADTVVLVDSWGFTLRVAQRIRALDPAIKLVKLVGPQVWATRPGRARTVAATYDALLCIHDFETPFYEGTGLPVTVVGNPALARVEPGDAAGFRGRHGLMGRRLVTLLPGSRPSEIARTAPVLEAAAAIAAASRPDVTIVSVLAPAVAAAVRERAEHWAFAHVLVEEDEKRDAFAAVDVALACSGTVTTEVAMQGAPVIVGYKLGWLTWAIARAFLMKARFITLMNVAADEEVAPEFVQTRFLPATVAATLGRLLDDPRARAAQVAAQNAALDRMGRGGPGAADRAAEAILAMPARGS